MRPWLRGAAAALAAACAASSDPFVGGYLLIDAQGVPKLQALAAQAATLPISRLWVSFFQPSLVYLPGSNSLQYSGLNLTQSGDYGFAILKQAIAQLQAGGVEVFLSMGGWNDNCFPAMYTYYSINAYPTGPNAWKIAAYSSNGQVSGCTADNTWCYTCEPPSSNTPYSDFGMFPEPTASQTWQQAISYISANAGGSAAPAWDTSMIPNTTWMDPKTGLAFPVPGESEWYTMGRDPYQDIVYLARDLNASGIDIDYEEMWHADYHKIGSSSSGPWTLPQTVYKYSAIAYDIILNIKALAPNLKLSTAAPAVGAWGGNWWGGNLKGVLLNSSIWYPEIVQFMSTGPNAGGINVMTYDLSDDEQFYECPAPNVCTLDQQVNFYMQTFAQAGIPANVGYETGTPAYPDPEKYPSYQLPLTTTELGLILQNTQGSYNGAFFWEIFKQPAAGDQVSPTQLAQALCSKILPGQARCSGSFPTL